MSNFSSIGDITSILESINTGTDEAVQNNLQAIDRDLSSLRKLAADVHAKISRVLGIEDTSALHFTLQTAPASQFIITKEQDADGQPLAQENIALLVANNIQETIFDINIKINRAAYWRVHLKLLQDFRQKNPDRWPMNNTGLGNWLRTQKAKMRNGGLTSEEVDSLKKLGVMPAEKQESFEDRLRELQAFRQENPRSWPPTGTALGNWLYSQRGKMANKTLTLEQNEALQSLGVEPTVSFNTQLSELRAFIQNNPGNWPPPGTALGKWLEIQRKKMGNKKLTLGQHEALERLGVEPAKI